MQIENNKKKEYLWQYRNSIRRQKLLEEEIRELRLNKMMPGFTQDGMPHASGSNNDLSGYMVRLDELEKELLDEINKGIDLRKDIVQKIEDLPTETERLLMRSRYIHGKKWEEISVDMEYVYRQVLRIHGTALRNFKI